MKETQHISVLLKETVDGLNLKDGGVYVDATLGGAGHSEQICKSGFKDITLIGIDADKEAIERSKKRLEKYECNLITEIAYNDQIPDVLKKNNIQKVDGIMFDLGMSSDQLDQSKRGFSFQKNEPLLMSMRSENIDSHLTAREVVNQWGEESIADILYGYGEEKYSRKIAKGIVEARAIAPILTTYQLSDIIADSVPNSYIKRGRNPATKTFQALRIVVNNELERLKIALRDSFNAIGSGGRIAVITFHSLEDRIVKNFFRDLEKEGKGKKTTKKPIKPSQQEVLSNPRSRSAQLRIFEKN